MGSKQLGEEDRAFLSLISRLIFSNPFSVERAEVRAALGDGVEFRSGPFDHALSAIDPVLGEHLDRLAENGITRIGQLRGNDDTLLSHAFLFDIYHAWADAFDELIRIQQSKGDEPVQVEFADELVAALASRGFNQSDINRYIALFYQFRRAFHFIARALVGKAPCMKRLRRELWNTIFTHDVRFYGDWLWDRMEDFSILLLGETGTGKGTAAAAIGQSGWIPFDHHARRFAFSFTSSMVATNLSQFPESLIESELFGHRKGAFTGAIDHHKGLFERCRRQGTLFLDEIGEVSIPIQIKLLNVLQERRFHAVGSHQDIRFEGRVIAATNRSLDELLSHGEFREDFYYRLSSSVIHLPSLRERLAEEPNELARLVTLIIGRMVGTTDSALERRILKQLEDSLPVGYPWPGNVRELEQAIRRILLGGAYHPVGSRQDDELADWLSCASKGELSMRELESAYCRHLYRSEGSYEAVARRTGLDRRTVKKYIDET